MARDVGAPDLNLTPMANWGFTQMAMEDRASRREFAHGVSSAAGGLLATLVLSRMVSNTVRRRR